MAFLSVVSLAYIVFDQQLVGIFTDDPVVLAQGADALRIIAYGYVLFSWGMVMPQAFNGAGDTLTPTKINFVCFWLLEIPLAYMLAMRLSLGVNSVYWSVVVAEVAAALIAIALFRRGKWKDMQV